MRSTASKRLLARRMSRFSVLLVGLGCGNGSSPSAGTTTSLAPPSARAVAASSATAETVASTTLPPPDAAARGVVLAALQGRWTIEKSSGDAVRGAVFFTAVGEELRVAGDVMVFAIGSKAGGGGPSSSEVRKTLRLLAPPANNRVEDAHAVDVDHRGDFRPTDPLDADAASVRANSQGWSRHALVRVAGDTMTLALAFPQAPTPADFAPAAGIEVVVLKRVTPTR